MKRLIAFASIFALALTAAACGGKQKKNENVVTDAPPPPPPAPTTPTCGGWIVLAEMPLVTAGGFNAGALQRSLLDGLRSGGCTGVTAIPAGAAAPVLKLSVKASSVGASGVINLTATDANTGELKWRFQERVGQGDAGTGAANGLGLKIATALGG
ncbi:MAG: hypothetical protein P1V51_18510 [Deltaproteobacteria bacterium]|nr:hypothetical protein [Deltaproteobacteria bacterium]